MILQTTFSLLAKCAGAVRKQIPYRALKASTLVSVIAEEAQNHL